MCVCCFTSNENCHFSSEKQFTTQNGLLIFPRKRDTFRNKIMEIVEDFDEKSYNNNGKPWKSSRILRVKPNCFIFSFFFSFFIFSIFPFFIFHFHSFSFIFFHFLSFSFIFLVGCSKSVFFWPQFSLRFLLDNSYVKNQFFGPISGGRYPCGPSFPVFSYFFSPFFVFLLAF